MILRKKNSLSKYKKYLFLLFSITNLFAENLVDGTINYFDVQPEPDLVKVYSQDFGADTKEWQLGEGWSIFSGDQHKKSVLAFVNFENQAPKSISTAILSGIDLSRADFLDAQLSFELKTEALSENISLLLEYSVDFKRWITLKRLPNQSGNWQIEKIPFDIACGYKNISLRISVKAELPVPAANVRPLVQLTDFEITASSVDNNAPLIIYSPKPAFESNAGENEVIANISDLSGVKQAKLSYRVDGGKFEEVAPHLIERNIFSFIIPPQNPGSLVEYQIEAVDNSAKKNSTIVSDLKYIAAYQPPYYLSVIEKSVNTLLYDAAGNSGIKQVALPVKIPNQDKNKSLNYLLLRSFPATNPLENSISLKFLKAEKKHGIVQPSSSASPSHDIKINENIYNDPFGFMLIDLREKKFSIDNLADSLLFLELTAQKGKTGLVYLPEKDKSTVSCYISDASTKNKWQNAEFTDSTGVVVYPVFQSDLIFGNRDKTKEINDLSESLKLQNIPNPLNNVTTIRFELGKKSKVSLTIYNILGKEIANLINGQLREGTHSVGLDVANFSSGIYYYILKVDNKLLKRKMVVTK